MAEEKLVKMWREHQDFTLTDIPSGITNISDTHYIAAAKHTHAFTQHLVCRQSQTLRCGYEDFLKMPGPYVNILLAYYSTKIRTVGNKACNVGPVTLNALSSK